jgi:hypothetical protein
MIVSGFLMSIDILGALAGIPLMNSSIWDSFGGGVLYRWSKNRFLGIKF